MINSAQRKFARFVVALQVLLLAGTGAYAQTQAKPLDLDGNGVAESQADLVVNTSGPVVTIVNTVSNGSANAFNFEWPSAGFGGFTSSVPAPIAPNVKRTVWTWTTTDPLVGYSGSTCDTDLCFSKTAGPSPLPFRSCNRACLDGVQLDRIEKVAGSGQVTLNFSGGQGPYTVYRFTDPSKITEATNALPVTTEQRYTDTPPSTPTIVYYRVRGTGCLGPATCSSNADCGLATEGFCTNAGPFGVPGRTKFGFSTPVTLSQGTLTSSLITFFSPGTEVFKAESRATADGVVETLTIPPGSSDVTLTIPAFPPDCCPESGGLHQLKCGGTCVPYLTSHDNCGACGVVCADDAYCSDGSCVPYCPKGTLCGEECVDTSTDNEHCGNCTTVCNEGTYCSGGQCAPYCSEGTLCGEECVDTNYDVDHCGNCETACLETECCISGHCTPPCATGLTLCGYECYDLANDSAHCGTCGTICGSGCCVDGVCTDLSCDTKGGGWSLCGTQCFRLGDDDGHCGSCDNACGEEQCCNGQGSCDDPCGEGKTVCAGECVSTAFDDDNCGTCGHSCDVGTCCVSGSCVSMTCGTEGTTLCGDVCTITARDPNHCGDCETHCPSGQCCSSGSCQVGGCPPQVIPGPQLGSCPDQTPIPPGPTACQSQLPPFDAYCPNSNPDPPPEPSQCDVGSRRSHGPASRTGTPPRPFAGGGGFSEDEAPICITEEVTQTIPPGEFSLPCHTGGPLFREVPSSILVCGDQIPGVTGECQNGTTGTFNRLVPLPGAIVTAGHAYVTPVAVHILSDTSHDGLLQPGETATLKVDVLNAGDTDIVDAHATLAGPEVDLTDDNVDNPKGVTVSGGPVSYPTIPKLLPTAGCELPVREPTTSTSAFTITVPVDHPGNTSRPMILSVAGTVDRAPNFAMPVPFSLGIGSNCHPAENARSYDGVEGLKSPMARLVPAGDTVPFPSGSFKSGRTRTLLLRLKCGSKNLSSTDIDPPEIVALTEDHHVDPIPVTTLRDEDTHTQTTFFHWEDDLTHHEDDDDDYWQYELRTSNLLGPGTYRITIRIAGRKDYVTGFVLY